MKVIEVPGTVEPKAFDAKGTPKTVSFKEFLNLHLDTYGGAKTPKQIRQLAKVFDIIEKSDGHIELEDADYDLVKAACEDVKYVAGFARQLIPYYDAIDKAQKR